MKCLSLFSGIGGFDLAFRNLGHQIVGACEIDKYGNFIFIQIKTNSWPSEKDINEFLYQKNIHVMVFNVKKIKSRYKVFYRFYKYYIPFISEKEN